MIADRDGVTRVRANIDGEVEIRVRVGDKVIPRQALVVVEGTSQLESLSVSKPSEVTEILVPDGSAVRSGTAVLLVREIPG